MGHNSSLTAQYTRARERESKRAREREKERESERKRERASERERERARERNREKRERLVGQFVAPLGGTNLQELRYSHERTPKGQKHQQKFRSQDSGYLLRGKTSFKVCQ